jgi:uncharacterized protein (TIGR02646 family)
VRGANTTAFTDYKQAREPLISAIGDYCSYCETPCQTAVEHVLPWEGKHAALELAWKNFLLACNSCNSHKRNRQDYRPVADAAQARAKYLWPDVDNTAMAFVYDPTNRVNVRPGLAPPLDAVAERTRKVVGLDVNSGLRWRRRQDAWTEARLSATNLVKCDTPEMRDQIARTAAGRGFWSVWRVVFAADADMLKRLNGAFAGTDPSSFDPTFQLVNRPGGQL